MSILIYLIPVALLLGALGLGTFLWSIRTGQYDDLDGAAVRILDDGDDEPLMDAPDRPVTRTGHRSADGTPPEGRL